MRAADLHGKLDIARIDIAIKGAGQRESGLYCFDGQIKRHPQRGVNQIFGGSATQANRNRHGIHRAGEIKLYPLTGRRAEYALL